MHEPLSLPHWACLRHADEVEVKFWERRGVKLYLYPLDRFLAELAAVIPGGVP